MVILDRSQHDWLADPEYIMWCFMAAKAVRKSTTRTCKSSVIGRVLPTPLAEAKAMRAINHLLLKLRATPLLLCWLFVLVGMPVTLTAVTPVVHIQYDSSATNGNQYLAEPSTSAGFDTAYTYGAPTWVDDTVNGQSVKVMNFFELQAMDVGRLKWQSFTDARSIQ